MDEAIWWTSVCGNATQRDAFWAPNLTLFSDTPDFPRCLQRTAFAWLPPLAIAAWTPAYLAWMSRRSAAGKAGPGSKTSLLNRAKIGVSLVLAILQVIELITYLVVYTEGNSVPPVNFITPTVLAVTYCACAVLQRREYTSGMRTSGTFFFFWSASLFVAVVSVRSHALFAAVTPAGQASAVLAYLSCAGVAAAWILALLVENNNIRVTWSAAAATEPADEKTALLGKRDTKVQDAGAAAPEVQPSPELGTTFVGGLLYIWFTKLVVKGWKKYLVFEDLYDLLDREKCEKLVPAFLTAWYDQLKTYRRLAGSREASVLRAILRAFGWTLIVSWLIRIGHIAQNFINPIILRKILNNIDTGDPYEWKGYALALAMFVSVLAGQVFLQRYLYHNYNFGVWCRSAITAAVYRKAMRLSSAAKRQTTVGEIVNIISVDAQKLQDSPPYLSAIWVTPLTSLVATALLWQTLGPSALAGVAVLLLLTPFNGFYVGNMTRRLQAKQMVEKDKRIKVMNEILSGIKVLKLYAWEPSFKEKVIGYREIEINTLKWSNILNGISFVMWITSPYLVSLVMFAVYTLSSEDHVLTADKVFVTMSLVNTMSFPLAMLPMCIAFIGQSLVAFKRIQRFLLLEEIDEDGITSDSNKDCSVAIKDGTFAWGRDEAPILKNIDLSVRPGSLVAIVGPVGTGKSSLLSAMLGEMWTVSGAVTVNGHIAYVPQQAWIQNATVRDNILFDKPYDAARYGHVLDACALRRDLQVLTHGEMTEIGEKGINLSGGQKARVSLARAVYQQEDVYLLDDPLSAVDAHVASHIFKHVLGPDGVLRDKTRILVTHSIRYLPEVDQIIVLDDGRITEVGTYNELLAKNGAFAEFLREYFLEKESDDDDSDSVEIIKSMKSQLSQADSHKDTSVIRQRRTSTRTRSIFSSGSARTRKSSRKSVIQPEVRESGGKLIEAETTEVGAVSPRVIVGFVRAGGVGLAAAVLLLHALYIVTLITSNLWLSRWSVAAAGDGGYYLAVYAAIVVTHISLAVAGAVCVALGCVAASRRLHDDLVARLLRAPMAFFDTTPLGRIINRISKDMDYLDVNIPMILRMWIFNLLPLVSTAILISYTTPIFLAAAVPIGIVYIFAQRVYIRTARQLRRVDSVKRSPLFIHLDESYVGATSIRAYRRQSQFVDKCDRLIDESQRAWYLVLMSQRWLGISMEALGSMVTGLATLLAVMQKDSLGPGLAGMSINFSLQVCAYLNMFVRSCAELETYMVAVERIQEYSNVDTEAAWEVPESQPESDWPAQGALEYRAYSTRYRPGLELVLKDISYSVKPGEKVGIVGRTGAGKSSMALSLFRLVEAAAGAIYIDGVDVATLGLRDLRSRLTIIPQDPVLFSGSLLSNLDPLGEHSAEAVWAALSLAHLAEFVRALDAGLDYEVGENGDALSVGQRQLVCLARALLRHSRLLVLDEATAAVDLETDALIQDTIRAAFTGATVLTVAHRINTVMDYDRVLVMEAGEIAEYDTPTTLLSKQDSIFYGLAKEAGLVK